MTYNTNATYNSIVLAYLYRWNIDANIVHFSTYIYILPKRYSFDGVCDFVAQIECTDSKDNILIFFFSLLLFYFLYFHLLSWNSHLSTVYLIPLFILLASMKIYEFSTASSASLYQMQLHFIAFNKRFIFLSA